MVVRVNGETEGLHVQRAGLNLHYHDHVVRGRAFFQT
jgi:hypothetical protein